MKSLKIVKESKRSQKKNKEQMDKQRAKQQGNGLKPNDTTLSH